MKTNVKTIGRYVYNYNPQMESGYFDPLKGWHLLKSNGILYYNYDSLGNLFFNKY